jgi:23S rRNA (cytosine1962-C5)-methyltransferase
LNPGKHDFIYGDTFDWLRRLGKKERRFDVIILDPPTYSKSKSSGDFQAARHYGRLITAALPLLNPDGVILASTNAARLKPEKWLEQINDAVDGSGRRVLARHYVPQPPDFPVTRTEPAYLKTVWIRVG